MNRNVRENELMEFLKAIEGGTIVLHPEREPQEVYAGNVPYAASIGWRITVFNDANEWDYIDHIQTSDGDIMEFLDIEQMPSVAQYLPSEAIAWSRYGIPGYCTFRCTTCGVHLTSGPPLNPPFQCSSCQNHYP